MPILVVLHNVPTHHLRKKVAAFEELYDTVPRVIVGGTFTKRGTDEPVFLLSHNAPVQDAHALHNTFLVVKIDGEWLEIVPDDDIIREVGLCS